MHIFGFAQNRGFSTIPVLVFLLWRVSQAHSFEPAILVINIVTAGFHSSKFLSSLTYNLPALQLAVSDMQTKYGKRFQLNHIVLADLLSTDCFQYADTTSLVMSKWYYTEQQPADLTAVIGPQCFEAGLLNQLASGWNIPFISTVQADRLIRNRQLSPTWLSSSTVAELQYTRLYTLLVDYFNWTTIFSVTDNTSLPAFIAFALEAKNALRSRPGIIYHSRSLTIKNLNDTDSVLHEFRKSSRILLFFGNGNLFRLLMIRGALLNITTAEYVYIAVEMVRSPMMGDFGWRRDDSFDQVGVNDLILMVPSVYPNRSSLRSPSLPMRP
ncbi:hypothetical protein RvY_04272 [Ramazzottius varieornatus]|uniref:Receptor ligand binding region domain-containing protein n=1 Tax=Ramazzottius varieornatus TaxID=947166 RepID=A0A1D1UUM6_RAMVA|nr:hypothetical protein RvY_04272 [Ramazzottius varieornatus]